MKIRKFNENKNNDTFYIKECFVEFIDDNSFEIIETNQVEIRISLKKPNVDGEYDNNNIEHFIIRTNRYLEFYESIKLAIDKMYIEYPNMLYNTSDTEYSYENSFFVIDIVSLTSLQKSRR